MAAKFHWNYGSDAGDFGPAIIAASDRMLTTGTDNLIEHTLPVRKGSGVSKKGHMFAAGAIQVHSQLLRQLNEAFGEQTDDVSIWELATKYGELFRAYKAARAEERYLAPLGLKFSNYLAELDKMPEVKAVELLNNLESYRIEFEALFIGFDKTASAILEVNADGTVINHDDIGYGAIGLGGPHATAHLMLTQFSPYRIFHDAMWSVFCAKRRGEAAPGVGSETDLVYVTRNGWTLVDPKTVDEMARVYEEMRGKSRERDLGIARGLAEFDEKQFGKKKDEPDT